MLNIIAHRALCAVLCGIANREWGDEYGTRVGSIFLVSLAFLQRGDLPIWSAPVFGLMFWAFRFMESSPWLDLESRHQWLWPILRSVPVAGFAVLLYVYNHQLHHLILGIITIFVIPIGYWLGGRFLPSEGTELGELIGGTAVGAI